MSGARTNGAKLLCEALQYVDIHHIFGLPGTQTVAMFDALRGSKLHTIVATHELSAAMMANGYYRSSGKPAALLTIPGPGFAWALAGLAEAALDSAALLHITGAPSDSPGRAFQLQALDQAALAAPLAKRVFTLTHASEVTAVIAEARAECLAGEPGPVVVQVAGRVWDETTQVKATPAPDDVCGVATDALVEAGDAISTAKRCVLLLGQGCQDAAKLVIQLAEYLNAPVVTTTSGRGVVPEDHPLSLGFELASTRTQSFNALIETADLVLAIGCKFSHNGARGFSLRIPQDKLIQVDASREVLGANYPARLAVHADARAFLAELLERLVVSDAQSRGDFPETVTQWRARCRIESRREIVEPRIHGVPSGKPAAFFTALRRAMPRESFLVTDSGQHQDLARRHFPVLCPRGLITPSDLQSMGFGIGAAIGACLANPDRPVVALIGDGGLAMSGLELATAVRERLQLTVIVFADGAFGAIRKRQFAAYGRAFGTTLPELDCAHLAATIEATYRRLESDPETVLRAALQEPGVSLVEVALGDTLPMHWTRARGVAKGFLGPDLKARVRARRGRSRRKR
jgi:acetolactate synthase-1/2/3 large subunit